MGFGILLPRLLEKEGVSEKIVASKRGLWGVEDETAIRNTSTGREWEKVLSRYLRFLGLPVSDRDDTLHEKPSFGADLTCKDIRIHAKVCESPEKYYGWVCQKAPGRTDTLLISEPSDKDFYALAANRGAEFEFISMCSAREAYNRFSEAFREPEVFRHRGKKVILRPEFVLSLPMNLRWPFDVPLPRR